MDEGEWEARTDHFLGRRKGNVYMIQYLEYYEQAIAGLVRLFNSRVSIEGWKPNE